MLLASVMAFLVCLSSWAAAEDGSNKYALMLREAGDQLEELKFLRDRLTREQEIQKRHISALSEYINSTQAYNARFREWIAKARAISDKNAEYWQALENHEADAVAAEREAAIVEQEAKQACSSANGANAVDADSLGRVKQLAAAVTRRTPQPLPFKLMEQTVKSRSEAFKDSLKFLRVLAEQAEQSSEYLRDQLSYLESGMKSWLTVQQRAGEYRNKLAQAAGHLPAAEFRALVEEHNLKMMIEGGTVDPNRLVLPTAVDISAIKLRVQELEKIDKERFEAIFGEAGLLGSGKSPDKLLQRFKDVKARFEAISIKVNAAVTRAASCRPSSGAGAVQGQPCNKGGGCPPGTQCGPQNTCVSKPSSDGMQEVQFAGVVFDAAEEAGAVSISVTRSGGANGQLTVHYRTSDQTAKASKDYSATTGFLTWKEGDSEPRTIHVPIINDRVYSAGRGFMIELFDPHNSSSPVRLGYQWQAGVRIIEDDLPPESIKRPDPQPRCSYLIIQPQNVEVAANRTVTFSATAVFDNGGRRDVTLLATWQATAGTAAQVSTRETRLLSPGSTYTAPGNLPDNQRVTIKAQWGDCEGETTINALAPSWSPPLSHADDSGARGETPGPLEFRHYVLCDRTGHVVTGTSYNPVDFGWMAGPIGVRHAEQWIKQNCPKALCTIDGAYGICAKEPPLAPTGGDPYYALCNETGHVVISRYSNLSGHVQLSPHALTGEAGARWWIEKNCPSWACTSAGTCVNPGQTRTGGNWAVVCSKRHGGVGFTEHPSFVDSWVWVDHLLTDADAKNWIAKNCPSERCDQNGRCLPGAAPQGRPLEIPPEAVLDMFRKRSSSRQAGGGGGSVASEGGPRPGRYSSSDLSSGGGLSTDGGGSTVPTTGSATRAGTTTETPSAGGTTTQPGGTVQTTPIQPGQTVKPQATTSTGGAGKFYLIEAVVAYGKREIVTGVGWRNLSCTLTHYTTAYANSQADLEKDRLGLGESVLGIVKNTSGALNPRLVSSRVVSGPSASQIKAPGHRIDCN